jgi:catechol 2,3-dioxygenase-like lactoylglutathione lyase family enzyme
MPVLAGLNHVAVLTANLDRFIEFYRRIFDLTVVFEERTPALSHAILRISPDSWLHPAELPANPHTTGVPAMFQRGHIDHIALSARSKFAFETLRARLVEAGASDGRVDDLGAFHTLWFVDPDGMRGEIALIVDEALQGIHEPRPLERAPRDPAPDVAR